MSEAVPANFAVIAWTKDSGHSAFPIISTPEFPSLPESDRSEAAVELGIFILLAIVVSRLVFLVARQRKWVLAAEGLAARMWSQELSRSEMNRIRRSELRRYGALKSHPHRHRRHHRRGLVFISA